VEVRVGMAKKGSEGREGEGGTGRKRNGKREW